MVLVQLEHYLLWLRLGAILRNHIGLPPNTSRLLCFSPIVCSYLLLFQITWLSPILILAGCFPRPFFVIWTFREGDLQMRVIAVNQVSSEKAISLQLINDTFFQFINTDISLTGITTHLVLFQSLTEKKIVLYIQSTQVSLHVKRLFLSLYFLNLIVRTLNMRVTLMIFKCRLLWYCYLQAQCCTTDSKT